jgi:hypothetical protein
MWNNILTYVIGLIITTNLIFCWFFTTMQSKIIYFMFNKTIDQLLIERPFWGNLFSCSLCFSTHISILISSLIYLNSDISYKYIVIASFTYPVLVLFAKDIYSKYLAN